MWLLTQFELAGALTPSRLGGPGLARGGGWMGWGGYCAIDSPLGLAGRGLAGGDGVWVGVGAGAGGW